MRFGSIIMKKSAWLKYNDCGGCVMPSLLICALALAVAAPAADVTIVIDFDGPHSERSIEQMKRETEQILKDSGLLCRLGSGLLRVGLLRSSPHD